MKIEESKSTATIVGDIQSNAVSIDINNIGFITQLLSTNLYSRPIESFLREIVSNAWDAHVEANNPEPILLELGTDTENRDYCRIQDFGIGLSPQRFNEVYRNIGSSTKRADNTQIGGFGIGRFSALAYSGTVYLTSNYQGTKYKYLMYKDGNLIKIDELFTSPTTDRDGLEVLVYLKSNDIYDFKRAIRSQLVFFENLYLSCDRFRDPSMRSFATEFNTLKIKKYNTFSVNTFGSNEGSTLCLGKIQYPLNSSSLINTNFKFFAKYPISVNFDIGDLEVTPNREQILYNKANIKKIEDQLNLVQDELDEIIDSQLKEDYDDFDDFVKELRSPGNIVTLLEDGFSTVEFKHKRTGNTITYKGERFKDYFLPLYDFVWGYIRTYPSAISFKFDHGRLITKNVHHSAFSMKNLEQAMAECNKSDPKYNSILYGSVYVGTYGTINHITKEFLRQSLRGQVTFLRPYTTRAILRQIIAGIYQELSRNPAYTKIKWNKHYLRLILGGIFEVLNKIPVITDKIVPHSFITERAALMKAKRAAEGVGGINWKEEVNLFVLRKSERFSYGELNVTSASERVTLEDLKTKWKGFPVIYSTKDDEFLRQLFSIFSSTSGEGYRKYRFVAIAPTKLHILKQFPNFIRLEDYMNIKYTKLRKLATARLIKQNYNHISYLQASGIAIDLISTKLREVLDTIQVYIKDNTPNSYSYLLPEITTEIDKLCEEHKYYDEEMMGYIREHDKLLQNSKFLTLLRDTRGSIPTHCVNLAVDYILTKQLFIPNLEAIKRLKEHTIFNIESTDENIKNP